MGGAAGGGDDEGVRRPASLLGWGDPGLELRAVLSCRRR